MRPTLLASLLFSGLASVPSFARAQASDASAVLAVVRGFHDALGRGDSTGALALLAPDVKILESGGPETREEYRSGHLPGDISFAQALPGTRSEPQITISGDVAWVVGVSRTTGTYRARQVNSAGAELLVLSRTPEGWRIRAIHWSSRAIRTP